MKFAALVPMRPAFSSISQAAWFAFILLASLLLPLFVDKSLLPSREQIYTSFWWENGPFPYIHREIFQEKGNIDIVFVGSSRMLHDINTLYVQDQLSQTLGRPAVVRSICWGGAGFDAVYFITKDLLEHRKVNMLVSYDDYNVGWYWAHALSPRWFRWADNAGDLSGLSIRFRLCYYFASVVGMPRNLLNVIRSNIPVSLVSAQKNYLEELYQAPNPAARLGSVSAHLGFGLDPSPTKNNAAFVEFNPPVTIQPSEVMVYSPSTQAMFRFSGPPTPPLPLHFGRRFAALAKEHDTKLVMLQMPTVPGAGAR